MATVKTIDVSLRTNTEKFSKGIKEAEGLLAGFGKKVAVIVAGYATFNAASNAASAALRRVGEAFESVDAAKKAATSLGLATGELQKLRFAIGEVAGVGAEGVDSVLQQMTRRLAEAAETGKGAAQTISRLGLNIGTITRMSADKAFLTLTDAINKVQGSGARAAIAMDLFGREGMKLLPIFSGTSEALKESMTWAERFRVGISEIDASNIEAANDTLNRLNTVLISVAQQVAGRISPELDALGKALISQFDSIPNSVDRTTTAFEGLGRTIAQVADLVVMLTSVGDRMSKVFTLGLDVKKIATGLSKATGLAGASENSITAAFDKALAENRARISEVSASPIGGDTSRAPQAKTELHQLNGSNKQQLETQKKMEQHLAKLRQQRFVVLGRAAL